MSNDIKISRELLSHAAALLSSVHSDVAHQLTALLAAPVVERQPVAWTSEQALQSVQKHGASYSYVFNKPYPEQDVTIALYAEQPAPVAVVQQCKIGIYGKAYDAPETKRAYTYEDQPDNLGAHKLGQAAIAASLTRGGDLIDSGLSLLRSLHGEGFGVFEIDACLDKVKELNQ